jgi:thioredoxin reductase (NADPH)
MDSWLTTIAFLALTAASMAWHVRRAARRENRPAPVRACPRCGARVPAAAETCPQCGVPLQAYEVVDAPQARAGGDGPGGHLHAIVRTDTCVGCGACVGACPEPGAIRLEGKLAVVDLDRCVGHGECARACPVGGIVLTTGAAVQRLAVPLVSPHFETNVFGLYVVGELGGRGLIKNAVNEGKIAMEHVAQRVRAARGAGQVGAAAGPGDVLDVIVVGSGPAGLSAGLTAHHAGLRYLVVEQGTLSDSIQRYPRHKVLMAEPVRVPLYGDLWVADTSKESLLKVWQAAVDRTGLAIRTGCRVAGVAKKDGVFTLDTEAGPLRSRSVVLALGRRGTPRRLGVPGEELRHVFYDIVEMEAFERARVLVVGGGDSAVESAIGLANQKGTQVSLSYRGDAFGRIKDRNREKLAAEVERGRVRLLLRSEVREIRAGSAVLETPGEPLEVPGDYVIIRIGGEPPHDFLRRAGVRIVEKEIALAKDGSAAAA